MAYIRWDVSPELFRIGAFSVRWYGLFFAVLFLGGFFIARWQFRLEGKRQDSLDDLLIYIVAGTIIGSRLAHVLFYEPDYYFRHPLEILQVWKGGLASHGGAVGVLLGIYLYSRKHPDQPYLWLLDRVAVPTALAAAMIRLGNLFNSEILGHQTTVPWAFIFVREDLVPRHPAQLYEALCYLATFGVLLWIYWRHRGRTAPGLLIGLFLVLLFSARFLLEFLKQRQADYEQNFLLSVGQLLSIPFILAGFWLLRRSRRLVNPDRG